MDSKKEIVPWICHVCNKKFHVTRGGLCSKCHKATCFRCLGVGTIFGISKQAKFENPVAGIVRIQKKTKQRKKQVKLFPKKYRGTG